MFVTKKKNAAAVALGKLRARKGPAMGEIGRLGGRARAKPTVCPRCGEVQPTARAAWVHCRKARKSKAARGEPKEDR